MMTSKEKSMLCQLDDKIVESFRNLKGEQLQLNEYRFGDNASHEGYVLTGGTDVFLIKTISKTINEKYNLYLLAVDQVWEGDLDEDIIFDPIDEGELDQIHIFSHSVENLKIDTRVIDKITSECAFMIQFKNRPNLLIYPSQKVFEGPELETDTDKILDVISSMHLHLSRTI